MLYKSLQQYVKAQRCLKNMTANQVADSVGISRESYKEWERGNSPISKFTFERIEKRLGLDRLVCVSIAKSLLENRGGEDANKV